MNELRVKYLLRIEAKNRPRGISCIYNPPSMNDKTFELDICSKLDQILIKYEHMYIISDLNYTLLVFEKSHTLRNIIDTYSLKILYKTQLVTLKSANQV